MCGIIGYIGEERLIKDTIIKGLKYLEYRGYDSSGTSFLFNNNYEIYKAVGKIKNLEESYDFERCSTQAIGHTRWATHGEVNKINSHPHSSINKRVILVHNGVINNYLELKKELIMKGYSFVSETDSEVIANLIEELLKSHTMLECLEKLKTLLEGSYALAIIDTKEKDKLYFIKNLTPLLIGKGKEGNIIISDVNAGSFFTQNFISLDDLDYGYITKEKIYVFHNNEKKEKNFFKVDHKINDISLCGFPHYMIKEIYEQPAILQKISNTYIKNSEICNINPKAINDLRSSKKVYIIGCGTSYHAGLVGKYIFEKYNHKSIEVHIASEFDMSNLVIEEDSFFILISQSGETFDVKQVLKAIKGKYKNLLLTNVKSSSLGRECDYVIDILAGPEIAVASTKAYSAQVAILILLSFALRNVLQEYENNIKEVCVSIQESLIRSHHILSLVKDHLIDKEHCFFIAKSLDYLISLEASLKLKEISYIHSEAFPSGELKHGTIALIEENTPVIGIISQEKHNKNLRSNLEEVKSRKAKTIVISSFSLARESDDFVVNDVCEEMMVLAFIPVFQLIAYYSALLKCKDIDKPRNLAKSVTVE